MTKTFLIRWTGAILLSLACIVISSFVLAQSTEQPSEKATATISEAWNKMFQQSQKEKKGLTFYIKGESVAGIVTTVIGKEAVEVRNQTFGKIIIRIESIDAIAIN